MSSHEKLSAAANDRKARLAQLKSLKRKQAPSNDDPEDDASPTQAENSSALTTTSDSTIDTSVTSTYLSGRNFDPTTRNVKLGFESQPIADPTSTLEYKAQQLALKTKAAQDAENADENKGLDLFKLQPKKTKLGLEEGLDRENEAIGCADRERDCKDSTGTN